MHQYWYCEFLFDILSDKNWDWYSFQLRELSILSNVFSNYSPQLDTNLAGVIPGEIWRQELSNMIWNFRYFPKQHQIVD